MIHKLATSIILLASLVLFGACSVVNGSGNAQTELRQLESVQHVRLAGTGDMEISFGEKSQIEIEADDNILSYIETDVRGDTLIIGTRNNTSIRPRTPIKYRLQLPSLASVKVSGSGTVTSPKLEAEEASLTISGDGRINIAHVDTEELTINVSGNGELHLAGQASTQSIDVSGSGRITGTDLQVERADVRIAGSGNVELWATEQIDVRISGSGEVIYRGNPTIQQSISGSGELVRAER